MIRFMKKQDIRFVISFFTGLKIVSVHCHGLFVHSLRVYTLVIVLRQQIYGVSFCIMSSLYRGAFTGPNILIACSKARLAPAGSEMDCNKPFR